MGRRLTNGGHLAALTAAIRSVSEGDLMNGLNRRARICLPLIVTGALLLGASVAEAATQTLGLRGWRVQSGPSAPNNGAAVSRPHFAAKGWLKVAADAGGAPGTEIEALIQNGRCPTVFFSTNMKRCFGYMSKLGPVTIPMFAKPW